MPLSAPRKGYGNAGSGGGGYSGLGIISTVREEAADLARIFGRPFLNTGLRIGNRDRVVLSLGKRVFPILKQGVGLPPLVSGTVGTEKTNIPPPIDRRDLPPKQEVVSLSVAGTIWNVSGKETLEDLRELVQMGVILVARDWFAYHKANDAGIPISPPYTTTETAQPVTTTTTTSGGSMDLGSIITDLGTSYIQAKYAPAPTIQPVSTQPAYTLPQIGSDIVDFFTDPATGTVVPVKKKKPCRRRRRRLATKSDLGDLAALKAILGNGEAFKAWIATHSR